MITKNTKKQKILTLDEQEKTYSWCFYMKKYSSDYWIIKIVAEYFSVSQ